MGSPTSKIFPARQRRAGALEKIRKIEKIENQMKIQKITSPSNHKFTDATRHSHPREDPKPSGASNPPVWIPHVRGSRGARRRWGHAAGPLVCGPPCCKMTGPRGQRLSQVPPARVPSMGQYPSQQPLPHTPHAWPPQATEGASPVGPLRRNGLSTRRGVMRGPSRPAKPRPRDARGPTRGGPPPVGAATDHRRECRGAPARAGSPPTPPSLRSVHVLRADVSPRAHPTHTGRPQAPARHPPRNLAVSTHLRSCGNRHALPSANSPGRRPPAAKHGPPPQPVAR